MLYLKELSSWCICMTKTEITAIIFIIGYAIISNYILLQFANLGIGINCISEIETELNTSTDFTITNVTNYGSARAGILDLALGRCEGLPTVFYLLFELPVIIGLIYIGRKFIGFT